jgi:hypothetical protein
MRARRAFVPGRHYIVEGALFLTVGYSSYPVDLTSGDRELQAMSRVE